MTPDTARPPVRRLDPSTLYPYLELHLVGATNGVRLFDAAHTSWSGTPYEEDFARLRMSIREERSGLKRLIRALGHRPSLLKQTLARGLSVLSAHNPLNPRRRTASAGAQLELEALLSLLKVKECMWATLLALPPGTATPDGGPALDRTALEQLLTDARAQQESVARVMTATAADRFLQR